MEGSKAIKASDALVKLKEDAVLDYAQQHSDIIIPFLCLQKELEELRSNAVDVRMKQVPLIMALKKKDQLF